MQCIYVIRNTVNASVYVGKTSNAAKRKADHWYCARLGDKRPLYCAMREIGSDHFIFEVIEECESETIAVEREKHWISHFDSFLNGYNLTPSGGFHVGNRGRKFSEEHKKKISEAHKGKVVSAETRQRMSNASRSRKRSPLSEEVRQKISEANKGRTSSEETRDKIRQSLLGRTLSTKVRQKISEAGRRRKHSPETIEKMKARTFSDEHRRKLSEAAKRREERKRQGKENAQ